MIFLIMSVSRSWTPSKSSSNNPNAIVFVVSPPAQRPHLMGVKNKRFGNFLIIFNGTKIIGNSKENHRTIIGKPL